MGSTLATRSLPAHPLKEGADDNACGLQPDRKRTFATDGSWPIKEIMRAPDDRNGSASTEPPTKKPASHNERLDGRDSVEVMAADEGVSVWWFAMRLILCSLLTTGVPACAADAIDVPPLATVREDVPPGDIQQFTADLDASDDEGGLGVGMAVHIVKLQPSVAWAPTVSLCTSSTLSARTECIRFTVDADDDRVRVAATSRGSAGDIRQSPLELPMALHRNDSFRVTMRVINSRTLTFAVNGNDVSTTALDFDAKQYTYACSSMVCDLTLVDLRPPQSLTWVGGVSRTDANLLVSGGIAMDGGDFDAAIQSFSEFIKVAPSMSAPYAQRARAWLAKGQLERALSDLDQALKVESEAKAEGVGDDELDQLFIIGSARRDVESLRDEVRAKLLQKPCRERDGAKCA